MKGLKLTAVRGIPGSGKSKLAREIAASAPDTLVYSADSFPGLYFTKPDGSIGVDLSKMGPAHAACMLGVIGALSSGWSVVVDNTNIPLDEISPYVLVAQAYGAEIEIVRVVCDPAVAYARQTHGVPEATHARMAAAHAEDPRAVHWPFIGVTVREVVTG